jgi:ABC-type transport system involved in multi-copper enzyme maturation permease subunit
MVWWKEWRETRFGFLTTLFFVTGLYYSFPAQRLLIESYWLGVFIAFFGMATAITLGSGAVAAEIGTDTIHFLISKPATRTRFLTAKYLIRAGETILVFIVPVLCLINWDDLQMWQWVRPYLFQKYILVGIMVIVFTYSGAFLFSIVFRKQALCALASIALLVGYLALRGVNVLQTIYRLESVASELYLLALLSLGAFAGSLLLFKRRDF